MSLTFPSETSIPKVLPSDVLAIKSARISSAFRPAFSEIVLGITSRA
jgi:hypothetical protein